MAGCVNNENKEATVIEATRTGYATYMKWSQSGFPTPLPESLKSILTEPALEKVLSDARWFGETGVQVQGDLEITEIKALAVGQNTAMVQVTANDDNVTFTVDGQPRNKLRNETRTSKVDLVYDTTWKINQITEVEVPSNSGS